MASSHLTRALEDLNAERRELEEQAKKIGKRLGAVKAAIESLVVLLNEDRMVNVVEIDLAQSLRMLIHQILSPAESKTARQIADELLALGYETKSADFANVVGTQLRAAPDMFQKMPDGTWTNTL